MYNKTTRYLLLGIIAMVVLATMIVIYGEKEDEVFSVSPAKKILAVCPTYYSDASKLDQSRYQIIKTVSTVESLDLIKNGKVDYVIAGRTLKPWEPKLDGMVFSKGYSFLSREERSVRKADLSGYGLFTDLETESLKDLFDLNNLQKVDDVYNYLDQGIVITSWENTDYNRAGLIHVMENDGSRVRLSRVGTLYCQSLCENEANQIIESLNN